jgi:hypothetical protein
MPRDRDADKLWPDTNEIAFRTVQAALGEAKKPEPPGAGEKRPGRCEARAKGRQEGREGQG